MFTEITLIREEGQPTLGEMLKAKVEEGVKVLMMVSAHILTIKRLNTIIKVMLTEFGVNPKFHY